MEGRSLNLILSRKGFDSAAGGAPSPIRDGRPVSLPIPASANSVTSYRDAGLGELVERITRGRIAADRLCHRDPMFRRGECLFGQCGAAQSHLANQGVGVGDIFLFFGLFADEASGERHHRIFGYLRVDRVERVDEPGVRGDLVALRHPHGFGSWPANNSIYRGPGAAARRADDILRLTRPSGPSSRWRVPAWLAARGLTYHGDQRRWATPGELGAALRGQEFVCHVGDDEDARAWIDDRIAAILG
jgi:hypothetical protein